MEKKESDDRRCFCGLENECDEPRTETAFIRVSDERLSFKKVLVTSSEKKAIEKSMDNDLREWQPLNALLPIVMTDKGIDNDSRLLQSLNAPLAMAVTPSGMRVKKLDPRIRTPLRMITPIRLLSISFPFSLE